MARETARVKALYASGLLRQIWKRDDVPGAAILWEAASEALPAMAMAIASTHIRMRRQSSKFTISVTAPIVQKFTRLATAPNTKASANERPATSIGRWAMAAASIAQNYRTQAAASRPRQARNPVADTRPLKGGQTARWGPAFERKSK